MANLYIDESGSMTQINTNKHPYFVICILDVKEPKKLKNAFKKYVARNLGRIRACDKNNIMFDEGGNFIEIKGSNLSKDLKIDLANYLCKNNYFKLSYIIVDNAAVDSKFYDNTARAFNFLILKNFEYCIHNKIMDKNQFLNIQIDERNIKTKAKYFLEEYLNIELVLNKEIIVKACVTYFDSSQNSLIQMADFFSNLFYSNLITNQYTELFSKMESEGYIASKFTFPLKKVPHKKSKLKT